MDFRKYVRDSIDSNSSIIEFGPLNRPLFNKNEFSNIYYADIRDTESIKKLYFGNEYLEKTGISVDINSIVNIDYVIKDTYKKTFKNKKFDVAYLSHVVEHMPDIIKFFDEISDILKDDGKLILIYPDKRYCFDHYRNSAAFRDAYATYKYGIKENARLSFDFSYNVIKENNAEKFWNNCGIINEISQEDLKIAEKYYIMNLNNKVIDDVHFWPFSDFDFLKFIYEMQRAKILSFEIEEFFPTQENTQEFLVVLKKLNKEKVKSDKTQELIFKYDDLNVFINLKKKEEESHDFINKTIIMNRCLIEKEQTIYELNQQKNLLEAEIAKLRVDLENINNCTSMKITKPLRLIKKFFLRGHEDEN